MNKIFSKLSFFFIAVAFLAASCSEGNQYKLEGQIIGIPDSSVVYMYDWIDGEAPALDTAYTVGGRFVMSGSLESPVYVRMIIDTTPNEEKVREKKRFYVAFFLENSKISIKATAVSAFRPYPMGGATDGTFEINGSRSEDIYSVYQKSLGNLKSSNDSLNKLYMEEYFRPSLDGDINAQRGVELANLMNVNNVKIRETAFDFIALHKNEYASALIAMYVLMDNDVELTQEEILTLMGNFDAFYPALSPLTDSATASASATASDSQVERSLFVTKSQNTLINYLSEIADTKMVLANGNQYIDLNLQDREGKDVKLSDYIVPGKYNFVEFWASWCGPCRGEIPHLRHINETFGDRISFISISIDESSADWHKAMEEEKMIWTQLIDKKGFFGEVSTKYKVMGIPYSVMIDPNGKLIMGGLRGAYLDAALLRLLD